MERLRASDYHPEILRLFDAYVHGALNRRDFIDRAGPFTAGASAAAVLASLSPDYALAQQVPEDDGRIRTDRINYDSPQGYGSIRAYVVRPSSASGKLPGVVVVHENRGLNPYIEDVARRLGAAGYLAMAPDGLTPKGGYPGNDNDGRRLQAELDRDKLVEDFAAAVRYLQNHDDCTGKVGAVGFCFGGFVVNALAVRNPSLAAAVPFYGRQPAADAVRQISMRRCCSTTPSWTEGSMKGGLPTKQPSKPMERRTRRTCIRARTTGSTTIRLPGSTRMPPHWRGSEQSSSSGRT